MVEGAAAGLLRPPKSPPPVVDGWLDVLAKRLEAAGLEASVGGAPAGVVEASENKGFAGVAEVAPAAVLAWAPLVV